MKTDIKNPHEYQNSTVSALTASDQESIKGVFDVALEYGFNRFKWDNSLFMEYGKQSIQPYGDVKTTDESADKILLSSDLAYAVWGFDSFLNWDQLHVCNMIQNSKAIHAEI